MLAGARRRRATEQLGVPGPWLDRLPHFRLEFTPSRGAELQSEYLVPRATPSRRSRRCAGSRERSPRSSRSPEIRTVATDELWLSRSYDTDVVGLHFTWQPRPDGVYAVLPALEELLLPLGPVPTGASASSRRRPISQPLYPRLDDFRELRDRSRPRPATSATPSSTGSSDRSSDSPTVDGQPLAARTCRRVAAVGIALVGPAVEGLGPVMSSAQRARDCRAGSGPAVRRRPSRRTPRCGRGRSRGRSVSQ